MGVDVSSSFALSFRHATVRSSHDLYPPLDPTTALAQAYLSVQSSRQAVLVMWQSLGNLFVTGRSFSCYSFLSVPYIALRWQKLSSDQTQL